MGKIINTKGEVSFFFNNDEEEVRIEVVDSSSRLHVMNIKLTSSQFFAVMGGMGRVKCELDVDIDNTPKVGKTMLLEKISFPMAEVYGTDYKVLAREQQKAFIPDGWESDNYFNSQDSFYYINKQLYARVTIRKWQ